MFWKSKKIRTRIWVYIAILAMFILIVSVSGTMIQGLYILMKWQESERRPPAVLLPQNNSIAHVGPAMPDWSDSSISHA